MQTGCFWFFTHEYTTIIPMDSTLIIVRGVPGSGKSYISSALAAALGTDATVVLDPDVIDMNSSEYRAFSADLSAQDVDQKFHPFRYLRQHGYDGILQHKTVIWNQAFNDFDGFEITVKRMQKFAQQHDVSLRVLVVEVEIDKETARSRIAQRAAAGGHDVPSEKLNQFVVNYQSFAGRGYDTIVVNGAGDSDESLRSIVDKLS